MATESVEPQNGSVRFTGSRWELAGIVLRGYLLMIPTIGLYRFWQATWKRRLYWQSTLIDGDPLEYTGRATQLLVGFLFALIFFVPIYVAFFFLATQLPDIASLGYALVGCVLWFLAGYAQYRGRDFRLSRTLWRGVRFDQLGSAWGYAIRRFLWSVLMVLTLGLIYPFMSANLWRYRWRHMRFGDRAFFLSGGWRQLAIPFYSAYALNVLMALGVVGYVYTMKDFIQVGDRTVPGPLSALLIAAALITFAGSVAYYRSRSWSRMLSTVTIGDASLKVSLRARDLFLQSVIYVLALAGLLIVVALIGAVALGSVFSMASTNGEAPDPAAVLQLFQSSTLNVVALIVAYLTLLGAIGLLAETILALGWWKLLARGASISRVETLRTVRSMPEDRALIGEGLADALNVGAY
jgi:uncharacterized membrane protein YjgN (DUF898 family)